MRNQDKTGIVNAAMPVILKEQSIRNLVRAANAAGAEVAKIESQIAEIASKSKRVAALLRQYDKTMTELRVFEKPKKSKPQRRMSGVRSNCRTKQAAVLLDLYYFPSCNIMHMLTPAERQVIKHLHRKAQKYVQLTDANNQKLERVRYSEGASLWLDNMPQKALDKLDELIQLMPKLATKHVGK